VYLTGEQIDAAEREPEARDRDTGLDVFDPEAGSAMQPQSAGGMNQPA
jgi:hypothetical protein